MKVSSLAETNDMTYQEMIEKCKELKESDHHIDIVDYVVAPKNPVKRKEYREKYLKDNDIIYMQEGMEDISIYEVHAISNDDVDVVFDLQEWIQKKS